MPKSRSRNYAKWRILLCVAFDNLLRRIGRGHSLWFEVFEICPKKLSMVSAINRSLPRLHPKR